MRFLSPSMRFLAARQRVHVNVYTFTWSGSHLHWACGLQSPEQMAAKISILVQFHLPHAEVNLLLWRLGLRSLQAHLRRQRLRLLQVYMCVHVWQRLAFLHMYLSRTPCVPRRLLLHSRRKALGSGDGWRDAELCPVIVVNTGQWDLGWASKDLEELQEGRGIPLLQMSSDLHAQVAKQTPPKP